MDKKINISLSEKEIETLKKSISEYQTVLEDRINLLRSYNISELNKTIIKQKEERIDELEKLRSELDIALNTINEECFK